MPRPRARSFSRAGRSWQARIGSVTVFGWDISHYDWERESVDLAAALRAGVTWFTHKATEGTSYVDPRYHATASQADNIDPKPLFGAYHVLHSGNIDAQVAHYLSTLRASSPWWQGRPFIIQLDCERWATDFPGSVDIKAWCDHFMTVTGGTHVPIVYASRGQYGATLTRLAGRYPLWNASYPSSAATPYRALYPGDAAHPWDSYSAQTPAIWQYASTGIIGNRGRCDVNAYRGSVVMLAALASPGKEISMKFLQLVREKGQPGIWLSDSMMTRRLVANGAELSAVQSWMSSNHLGIGDGTIVETDMLDAFGVPIPFPPAIIDAGKLVGSVTLSGSVSGSLSGSGTLATPPTP